MDNEILYNTEGKALNNVQKQNNYEIAYKKASEDLSNADVIQIANKSGTSLININGIHHIVVPFINKEILISYPDVSVFYNNKETEVPLWLKILALHYLIQSKGTHKTGDQITFKQLEGGLGYFPAFHKRTIVPLLEAFGGNLNNFIKSGEMIGGIRVHLGDYALLFKAFPKIDILFVLWEGDEEVPSDGNIIFDSSIADYLTTEDIAVCSNMIAIMITKYSAASC